MNETNELSIIDIVRILLKKKWFILGTTIAGAVLALLITKIFITPMYEAVGTMYVSGKANNSAETALTINDVAQSQRLVQSYTGILQSKRAAKQVLAETQLAYKVEDIQKMISLTSVNESELMKIAVTCKEPADAVTIANSIMGIAPGLLAETVKVGNATVIDTAEDSKKVSPNTSMNTIIGFMIGLIISILVVLVINMLDQTVKDEDDVTENYHIPILGSVPNCNQASKGGSYAYGK